MSKPLVTNSSDENQIKKAAQTERNNRETELNDLRSVLSTPSGRRVIWRLLSRAGIFNTSMHASGSMVYFNEGRRDQGLKLLVDITDADEDAFALMQKESKEKDQ